MADPRDQLKALRVPLIDLHRALLDAERREYEAQHGRVAAAELLQLALTHAQFEWLHQVSTIIVRVDELIALDESPGVGGVGVVTRHLRSLLRPQSSGTPFEQRYDRAIQADPAVLLAHRRVMQSLPPDDDSSAETIH